MIRILIAIGVHLCAGILLIAQEPTVAPHGGAKSDDNSISAAALAGSKQDPAAVDRGGKDFQKNCAGCHGTAAKGGPGAPDLIRSLLVLDDEKGNLIAPVIREGRPDKGMPKLNLSEAEISDIVAWLHVRTYAAGHRTTYSFGNVITGDAAKGKAYFEGDGKCSTCHSVTGDLAGIGKKYDPISLQGRWIQPRENARGGRGGAKKSASAQPTVTVTDSSGNQVSGTLDHVDDFTVSLRDAKGQFHSFSRNGDSPQVVVKDPLQGHLELLPKYTDADIHNITAYLVTLK
jgi:cytochrome c oxidase cbb3-type subunit 3